MTRLRFTHLVIGLVLLFSAAVVRPQDPAQTTTGDVQTDEEKQKEKEAAEKKATALLEQIIAEVQLLKLPENRIRVQITAGDVLWKRNEVRARSMFLLAADGVAEMMRSADGNMQRRAAELRQEVVLTAALHDASLAYQLLATTRSLTPAAATGNDFRRRPSPDFNLEENLLARVAAIDPKLAAQKVEEELAKGQYPNTLPQIIARLQTQDKEAASKLSAKVVGKLQTENMLANVQAQTLALNLLRAGPVSPQTATANSSQTGSSPVGLNQSYQVRANNAPLLSESAFQDLMNTVIDAALKATPQTATNQPGQTNQRRQNNARRQGNFGGMQNADQGQLTDGQIEQQNSRRLLSGLQMVLPQIDQYLASRATTVRNKMIELGMDGRRRGALPQFNSLMRDASADSLLTAAATAPPALQSRIYQQAVQKALEEGNNDRARQIATDHLDGTIRDRVLQQIDVQLMAKKVEAHNLNEFRQTLANLRTDDERIDLLLQLAAQAQWAVGDQKPAVAAKGDPKLALQFLTEAQRLTTRRATNYEQFEQQLRVARALAELDPARSFDVLDPGISQLNELLAAAALLSGFEVSIFREGELPLEGGSRLGNMVARYGQVLATLAKKDFARAESSANRFQLAEPRLMSQLAIVRNVIGVPEGSPINRGFRGGRELRRERP
jgi:hypothetical protein